MYGVSIIMHNAVGLYDEKSIAKYTPLRLFLVWYVRD